MKRAYDNFIQPSSRYADIVSSLAKLSCHRTSSDQPCSAPQIVPGFQNEVSVKLLVTHIQQQLDSRAMRFRNELGQRGMAQHTRRQSLEPINLGKEIASATGSKVRVPENTVVLEQTNQLRVRQRRNMLHRVTQVICLLYFRVFSPSCATKIQIGPVSFFTPTDCRLWWWNGVCSCYHIRRKR